MRRMAFGAALALLAGTLSTGVDPASAATSAVQPQRVLDTRSGLGAPAGRVVPGAIITLPVTPATSAGASAVSLNVTATDATAPGYLTAWPCGQPVPPTSLLNFVPGRIAANFAALGIGTGGVCVTSSAPVHVVVDLEGWFSDASDFTGSPPSRLLDTRVTRDQLAAGSERHLSVAAGAGIPGPEGAVALNVTVVDPAADGFVVAYPCGPRPLASTVNFRAHEIVPNFTLVAYSGREVCLFSSVATDVVVDIFGWSSGGDGVRVAAPARLLDTRSGVGASGAAGPTAELHLRVAGRGGVPNDAAAALVTITATGGSADGYVTAWPCDQPRPVASVLNLRPGLLGSNLTLLRLAGDGTVCLYAWTGDGSTVHFVADAVGWLPGGPSRPAPPPEGPVGGSGHFVTLPVGATLPSDADCAARVRKAPEIRAGNAPYNNTVGHPTANPPSEIYTRVTGNFTGTTDEIIQWASCKWGIDEDIVRAQTAKESWWNQKAAGDLTTAPANCAPGHPIGADGIPDECPESIGLMQVRYPFWQWAFPDSGTSSAYNMDVALAARRSCFEGNETWLNTVERGQDYVAGDIWGCVGNWFSGRWYTQPSKDYIAAVQDLLDQRIWETPDFISFVPPN